ncbi:hypothetical protein Q8G38_00085 [Halomonas venusta]|uniref:hypothetical protein n=1 Tax=Vreelandella TaxID=3137766 RepID=UPI00295E3435|nr:hypothetical protein [Halomonas venusta]MDW0357707.1 hypothetical protein [Halomonas venusta]
MFSAVWSKVAGVLIMTIGLLGAALLFVGGQRERAKEAASRAKAEAASKSAVLEIERAIDNAKAQAREQSNEVKREADERPKSQRPTGSLRR